MKTGPDRFGVRQDGRSNRLVIILGRSQAGKQAGYQGNRPCPTSSAQARDDVGKTEGLSILDGPKGR